MFRWVLTVSKWLQILCAVVFQVYQDRKIVRTFYNILLWDKEISHLKVANDKKIVLWLLPSSVSPPADLLVNNKDAFNAKWLKFEYSCAKISSWGDILISAKRRKQTLIHFRLLWVNDGVKFCSLYLWKFLWICLD